MRHRFHEGDLVVKKVTDATKRGKLTPNWKGSYRVRQRLNKRDYKLYSFEGDEIPRTSNVTSLKFYLS